MCSRSSDIDIKQKKEDLAKYLSHTPPESMLSAMAEMETQCRYLEQTSRNIYECMKTSIGNRISIYSDNTKSTHTPRWKGVPQPGCTEYVTAINSQIKIDISKQNSIYLHGLHKNTVIIVSDIAHLMLIECTNIHVKYVHAPISGISLMRCTSVHIEEDTTKDIAEDIHRDIIGGSSRNIIRETDVDMIDDISKENDVDMMETDDSIKLGYLDCEYSSNINIEGKLDPGFTLYCVGSVYITVNNDSLDCNIYDQIFGRTDDLDLSFLLGKSGTGMVYNK